MCDEAMFAIEFITSKNAFAFGSARENDENNFRESLIFAFFIFLLCLDGRICYKDNRGVSG